jgi:hypothetical protein
MKAGITRFTRVLALAVILGVSGVISAGSAGAASPSGGAIRLYASLSGNGSTGSAFVVGAIADRGTVETTNQSGKADENGNFVKVSLKKGTFRLSVATLNQISNKATPTFYQASCSAYLTVSGPVTISDGTGAYTGISGSATVTLSFAFIGPRYSSGSKKGQCNTSNSAQPIASGGFATGAGTVSFNS